MKKVNFYLSFVLMLGAFFALEGVSNNQNHPNAPINSSTSTTTQEKYDLMRRDEIDNTDSLAIPLDESEIEDEEQIDFDDKKEIFPLPQKR